MISVLDKNLLCSLEPMSARRSAGLKAKDGNWNDISAMQRDEPVRGTHEPHRSHAIRKLIAHHLRDWQILDGRFKG